MRKWPIMIIVINILIWIGYWRKEFQNDRRVEGWMKIDFFNLLFLFFLFLLHRQMAQPINCNQVFFYLEFNLKVISFIFRPLILKE